MRVLPSIPHSAFPKQINRGFRFIWLIIKREMRRNLTVMVIPHNSIKPVRLSFSFRFLVLTLCAWTGFTLWAGYVSSRHIDYFRVKADHKLMQLKVTFFAEQVKKSQEMLEQVQENDAQVRALLQMKSKNAIIETDGKGGPSSADVGDLNRLLTGRIYDMSQADIERQTLALQEQTRKQLASFREIMSHIDHERSVFHSTPNMWPCRGHITSCFGYRVHPIYEDNEFHAGMDIANDKNTQIHATADGVVRMADWTPGYGRLVIIEHGHGYRTLYGHMSKILVKANEPIRRGQLIGLMGSTGTSTGNHVHYEIQYNGTPVNPSRYLKKTPSSPLA